MGGLDGSVCVWVWEGEGVCACVHAYIHGTNVKIVLANSRL